jgi:hypothetical protein
MDHTMEQRKPLKEPLREAAGTIGSRVAETLEITKGPVQLGPAIKDTAQRATVAAGKTLHSLAGTIRDRAPEEGLVARAAGSVADILEGSGTYLQERGIAGAVDDLAVLIRRYPAQSLFIGIGIGLLLARRSRS